MSRLQTFTDDHARSQLTLMAAMLGTCGCMAPRKSYAAPRARPATQGTGGFWKGGKAQPTARKSQPADVPLPSGAPPSGSTA